MKRIIHAQAALWPLAKVPPRTGPSPCKSADLPIRKIASESADQQISEYANLQINESTLNNKTIFHLDRRYCNVLAFMTLFMCLIAAYKAPAQTGAAANMDEIQPLQIGDTIPEELWHLPLQVVNHPEGKETITLNDYRGKLIILDFWATWCGSCIAAMPKIAEIQRQFADDMVVVPVSWSKPEATEITLTTHEILRTMGLSSIVTAKPLIDKFPHRVVPFYAWISHDGKVVATTATNDVTEDNIMKVLDGNEPDYALMTDMDPEKVLLLDHEKLPRNTEIQKYAILISGRIPSLPSGSRYRKKDEVVYGKSFFNTILGMVYYSIAKEIIGENFSDRRIIYEFDVRKHPQMDFKSIIEGTYLPQYLVSYEFIVAPSQVDSLYHLMLDELNSSSSYVGEIKKMTTQCLVLSRSDSNDHRLLTKPFEAVTNNPEVFTLQNQPIRLLANKIERESFANGLLVVDETGIKDPIFVNLSPRSSLSGWNEELGRYGLVLHEMTREIEFLSVSVKSAITKNINVTSNELK